jgi:hypothetical protein
MIMISKLEKKLNKHVESLQNAVIIGQGFGHLSEILKIFNTVFVFSEQPPEIKNKNLVYRMDFSNIQLLQDVSVIFVDQGQVSCLEHFYILCNTNKLIVCVEGTDEVSQKFAESLRSAKYSISEQHKRFHIWKKT